MQAGSRNLITDVVGLLVRDLLGLLPGRRVLVVLLGLGSSPHPEGS